MSTRHTIKSEDLSWRAVGDELVILDLRGMRYLSLNGTGAVLWTALENGASDDELVGLLIDRFERDGPSAERDVDDFLRDCRGLGLLE